MSDRNSPEPGKPVGKPEFTSRPKESLVPPNVRTVIAPEHQRREEPVERPTPPPAPPRPAPSPQPVMAESGLMDKVKAWWNRLTGNG